MCCLHYYYYVLSIYTDGYTGSKLLSYCIICSYIAICDWILENGSKSYIFISVYLSLQHEKYCIPNNIS